MYTQGPGLMGGDSLTLTFLLGNCSEFDIGVATPILVNLLIYSSNRPCMVFKINFKVTKCLLPLPYWRFFSPIHSFWGGKGRLWFKRLQIQIPHFYLKIKEPNVTIEIPVSGSDTIIVALKTKYPRIQCSWACDFIWKTEKLQCLVEEGWHLATLFFL